MTEDQGKRVSFHTLGCKLNYAETAMISKQFIDRGFRVVGFGDPTDVFVLNTCSVTERTDRECRQLIRKALRVSPSACAVVVGCYAQLQPEEIASIEGVDFILGAKEKFELFRHVEKFEKRSQTKIARSLIHEATDFGSAFTSGSADRTRAFLKVQDGCDYHCAFCTIPLARGASRSQSIETTVQQARHLVQRGYKEIVLTGVNVGDYGRKDGTSLLFLLRGLEEIDGLERIRISSIEPNLLTHELVGHVRESKKTCHHFHIPLQSGSDKILKRMRRRYLTRNYQDLIHLIMDEIPEAGIGADVIVGFPGETDAHFEETYLFLVDLPLSYLHVFTYSERPDTDAVKLPEVVSHSVRTKRSEMLRILSDKKRRQFYESFVGQTVSVLLEGRVENGRRVGHTSQYVKVALPVDSSGENEIKSVQIIRVENDLCMGEVVGESAANVVNYAESRALEAA